MKNFCSKIIRFLDYAITASTICIAFFSCSNFLSGGDFKDQLENDIEYAEGASYQIRVECDEGTGAITTIALLSKKVTDEFSIEFKIAEGVQFLAWKAYTKEDDGTFKEISSDYIKFIDFNTTAADGIYKATVKFLKAAMNIYIKPVCLILPCVQSYSPQLETSGSYANMPIVITFNIPMKSENSTEEESLFNYQNILLKYETTDMKNCFEKPKFNSEKTILTLMPKSDSIKSFINQKNLPFIDISVSLTEKICVQKDGLTLSLAQNENSSFTVRYKPEMENTAPVKHDFFATRKSLSFENADSFSDSDKFTQDSFEDNDSFSILKNRTSGTVYIYGKYYDADSGVKTVKITEQRIKTSSAEDVVESVSNAKSYTSENAEFYTNDGYTTFCIPYKLESDDGKILVNLTVLDACENVSQCQSFYAIKKGKMEVTLPLCNNVYWGNSDYPVDSEESIEAYNNDLNNIYIFTGYYMGSSSDICKIYGGEYSYTTLPVEYLTITCEYTDKNGQLKNVPFEYFNNRNPDDPYEYSEYHLEGYKLSLDIDSVEGFSFRVTVADDMGLTYEKTFEFPSRITNIILASASKVSFLTEKAERITDVRTIRRKQFYNDTIGPSDKDTFYLMHNSYDFNNNGYVTITSDSSCHYRASLYHEGLWGPFQSEEFNSSIYSSTSLAQVTLKDGGRVEKTSDPKYLNVIYTVDESAWSTYDTIYFQYNATSEAYYFDKTTNTCTIPRSTTWLLTQNSSNNYTYLYGVKGTRKTSAKKVTYPNVDAKEFDTLAPTFWFNPPYLYHYSKDYDYYSIMIQDNETGIKKVDIVSQSGGDIPVVEYDTGHKGDGVARFDIDIPVSDVMRYSYVSEGNSYINIKLTDAAGNTTTKAVKTGLSEEVIGKTSTGKYDLILPNGAQKDSVAICSDAPVYVHTVYTTSSTTDVSSWTLSKWEENKMLPSEYSPNVKETGCKFLIFSGTEHSPQRYAIPIDEISTGCHYVVIAHFADGSSAISNVHKK